MEITLEQVKEFLEANKDNQDVLGVVKEYAPQQEIGLEQIKELSNSEGEVKKWLEAEKDRHLSKGIETFKQKTMPGLIDEKVDEKVKELHPEETEEQKRIRKLEQELESSKKEKQRESLRNKAINQADGKLPRELIDFLIADDEENTVSNIEKVHGVFDQYVSKQVDERLKGSYTPPAGGNGEALTREQIQSMSAEEINKAWEKNPDAIQKALNQK